MNEPERERVKIFIVNSTLYLTCNWVNWKILTVLAGGAREIVFLLMNLHKYILTDWWGVYLLCWGVRKKYLTEALNIN